jgi:hypothetical protein
VGNLDGHQPIDPTPWETDDRLDGLVVDDSATAARWQPGTLFDVSEPYQ